MSASDATSTSLPPTLDAAETTAALATDVVVRWWQTTSFLRVCGPDAATLLDGLCTQAVERIAVGHAVLGLFLDAKARIIAPTVLHRVDDAAWTDPRTSESIPGCASFLLETLPDLVEPLRSHLAKYRLRAKATIEPDETSSIALVGPRAADVAAAVEAHGTWTRRDDQAAPTMTLLADSPTCAAAVRELLPAAGAQLAAPDALEAARIEAGIADLHDLLPGRMPAEVGGMQSAVALDAGCYLGQEPVARLHYRGHANRTLRRLSSDGDVTPAELPLDADGHPDLDAALALRRPDAEPSSRPTGRLTTWARRPDGTSVALGMVRREVAAGETLLLAGTNVSLTARDAADEA